MQTKEKLTEIIKSTIVNAHGTKLGDVFHPEFVENIVNNLIEGGAIVPPCKVGDTIWFELYGEVENAVIYSCDISLNSRGFWISDVRAKNTHGMEAYFNGKSIGKTIFLTREEAERALKGGEGE